MQPRAASIFFQLKLRGQHFIGPHHLVVFVLEDVAVPNIAARIAFEAGDNPRHHLRVGAHGVFPSGFTRIGRQGGSNVLELALHKIVQSIEGTAVENLKADQVEVDGMNIFSEVDQAPDFD
jgi:hypothetical protein